MPRKDNALVEIACWESDDTTTRVEMRYRTSNIKFVFFFFFLNVSKSGNYLLKDVPE